MKGTGPRLPCAGTGARMTGSRPARATCAIPRHPPRRRRPRGARAGLDERDHGARVTADGSRQPASFDEDLPALADAHHRTVHAREHLEHARETADVLFLAATLGEVALAATEAHDLPVL